MILKALGALIFIVGIGLFIGNVSGKFPTFPGLGWLGMFIGGAVYRTGARNA
ncbi:MAG: hypothetical protein JO317_08655 [Verrucomicrobiae bacterium]|nr:hypothetical protein [Verrucomicrobiae bacterium]